MGGKKRNKKETQKAASAKKLPASQKSEANFGLTGEEVQAIAKAKASTPQARFKAAVDGVKNAM